MMLLDPDTVGDHGDFSAVMDAALSAAVAGGHHGVVAMLVDAGADLDTLPAESCVMDRDSYTHAHTMSCAWGGIDTVRYDVAVEMPEDLVSLLWTGREHRAAFDVYMRQWRRLYLRRPWEFQPTLNRR